MKTTSVNHQFKKKAQPTEKSKFRVKSIKKPTKKRVVSLGRTKVKHSNELCNNWYFKLLFFEESVLVLKACSSLGTRSLLPGLKEQLGLNLILGMEAHFCQCDKKTNKTRLGL